MSEEKRPLIADVVEDENEETIIVNNVTNNRERNQQNPLMRAVRQGSVILERIELNGYDLLEIDSQQRNVFHYAVSKPKALRKLLTRIETETFLHESVQEALHQTDKEGDTPIHRAARIANIKSLELLHEFDNSLIKLKTEKGKRSVLHLAVKSQSVLIVKSVLHKDPDLVNIADTKLQTPVHYAASLEESSIMKVLISNGSDTTVRDANAQLAIHIAARQGLRNHVQLLLGENPDLVDITDNSRQSSLMLAAKNGFPDVVSHLLAENASYELKDKQGLTAFDWAVRNNVPEVVKVFLDTNVWKELVNTSNCGPDGCLAAMIENMPEMAKMLLDKCVTTKGTKDDPEEYKVTYDFFCLEETDKNNNSGPSFEALNSMVKHQSEICLRHPVAVKYLDVKWRKRGFKFSLAYISLGLIFQICLITYVTNVIGEVNEVVMDHDATGTPEKHYIRDSTPPDAAKMMALRIIMLVLTFGEMLNDIVQMFGARSHYFTSINHYFRLALLISVTLFLLPVNQTLTRRQIGCGAVSVLLSWLNLMQFLKLVPVLGTYLILVEKVLWTLIKIFIVVLIYLLSFATTFYVLLAEHDQFRNIYISLVSTFVAMMSSMSGNYEDYFVTVGWLPKIYEEKMFFLVLFMLTMAIVVNNVLIGLAVGDAREVMKSARFDKYLRKARFVIYLEKNVNRIPWMKVKEDRKCDEFPERRRNFLQQISDVLYSGDQLDVVDATTEKEEQEMEMTLAEHFEKAVETKVENLRLSLRKELREVRDQIKQDRKDLDQKMERMLEKLK